MAYEPHPVLYECLCRNCPDALAFPYALGKEIGEERFHILEGDDAGSSHLLKDYHREDIPVKVSTLNEDLAGVLQYRPLSLIKIDAEGCEPEVLAGAEEIIRLHHPVLVIEVNNDALARRGSNHSDIKDFLKRHDYRHSWVGEHHWHSARGDIICS